MSGEHCANQIALNPPPKKFNIPRIKPLQIQEKKPSTKKKTVTGEDFTVEIEIKIEIQYDQIFDMG